MLFKTMVMLPGTQIAAPKALAFVPPVAVPGASFGPICGATGLCSASPATGFLSLQDFLGNVVVPTVQTGLIGVGVLYAAWYALEMIVHGYEEQTFQQQKSAFSYAAMGMGIVGVSALVVQTFAPATAGTAIVDPSPFSSAVQSVVDYLTIVTGAFIVFVISMAGFRIIALQGEESEIEKQKKNFFNGLLGVPILLLARVVVNAIVPSTGTADDLVVEAAGIVNFLLSLIAGLSVVALMAAGFLFVVALHNDTLKQRAKRIAFSTMVVLIIVIFSYTLVSTFLPATTPPSVP